MLDQEWCSDCGENLTQEHTQCSMSWEEVSQLSHATQVARFGWCICEDTDGEGHLHEDCPREEN